MSIKDYSGREVKLGELLLDERGRVYRVVDTPPGISKEGLTQGQELRRSRGKWVEFGALTYIRAYHCFIVGLELLEASSSFMQLWAVIFTEVRESSLDAEMRSRHQQTDKMLREMGIRR